MHPSAQDCAKRKESSGSDIADVDINVRCASGLIKRQLDVAERYAGLLETNVVETSVSGHSRKLIRVSQTTRQGTGDVGVDTIKFETEDFPHLAQRCGPFSQNNRGKLVGDI